MLTIGTDTVVKANIATVGTVVLNGRLEGTVCCTRLEISETGYLLGSATVDHVIISGQLIGEVRALTVEVMRNAIVEADVFHREISVDEDAVMSGSMTRIASLDLPASMRDVQSLIRNEEAEIASARSDLAVRKAAEAKARDSEFEQLRAIIAKLH